MAFSPLAFAECARLNEMMAASEEDLAAQRVFILRARLALCSVAPQLAKARVKAKCRGCTATLMKSEVYGVPEGGGPIELIEPVGDLVYEGDGELQFELCRVRHWWRSSSVLASGCFSTATVLGTVGLGGDTASWTVPLISTDGRQRLASLEVSIRCQQGSLGTFGGGGALKKLALPKRPTVDPDDVGRVLAEDVRAYCTGCRRSTATLQQATALADGLAKARGVEEMLPPLREAEGKAYCTGCRRSTATLQQATALADRLAKARGVEEMLPPLREAEGKVSL